MCFLFLYIKKILNTRRWWRVFLTDHTYLPPLVQPHTSSATIMATSLGNFCIGDLLPFSTTTCHRVGTFECIMVKEFIDSTRVSFHHHADFLHLFSDVMYSHFGCMRKLHKFNQKTFPHRVGMESLCFCLFDGYIHVRHIWVVDPAEFGSIKGDVKQRTEADFVTASLGKRV